MNVFLTGKPGSGKTTVLKKALNNLDTPSVGGFFTPEMRESGSRVGFKLRSFNGDEEGILASTKRDQGPKISKYRVNLDDLDRFSEMLMEQVEEKEIVALDEIGVMELQSDKFKEALNKAINSDKTLLATLHTNLINDYRNEGKVIWVTRKTNSETHKKVLDLINY